MDPVSQFKFACPVCGQHLQARAHEAGQTTECPSCFKKLTVPQAPTNGGGKLIITASLAEARRGPLPRRVRAASGEPRRVSTRGPWIYVVLALVASAVGVGVWFQLKRGDSGSGEEALGRAQLWTDDVNELTLPETPVVGRLNGWDFALTQAQWRDTKLILRQNGGDPEGLRLVITFPLKGGELVPGKTFRVGAADSPFNTPIRMIWKAEGGRDQDKLITSGYVLRIQFDAVSKTRVSGRLHVCLPDTAHSWVAGSFSAENKTRPKAG